MQGKICKHQLAVWKFYECELPNFPPVSSEARHELAVVALGSRALDLAFYEPLTVQVEPTSSRSVSASLLAIMEVPAGGLSPPQQHQPSLAQQRQSQKEGYDAALADLLTTIQDVSNTFGNDDPQVTSGMKRLTTRLQRLKTPNQLASFYHWLASAPYMVQRRAGAGIHVNSAARQRRKQDQPKGNMPLQTGRNARAHNLANNVKLNQQNAKKH